MLHYHIICYSHIYLCVYLSQACVLP